MTTHQLSSTRRAGQEAGGELLVVQNVHKKYIILASLGRNESVVT
jgi:hypothetical protein